jgi:uncharacterized protein YbjT (DUF2867 family)
MKPLNVIVTGATGMVGEGVVYECLRHNDVKKVLIISRRPSGMAHEKLTEIIHTDFYDLVPIETQLQGYETCFFCLGVSSVGMKEEDYLRVTHTLTLHMAQLLSRQNPDMTFCYISGAGTDGTEKGRSMWARVKGKTENDLKKLPFRRVFAFRPGFIRPIPGLLRIHNYYRYIGWLFPIGRALYPAGFCTLRELALALIQVAKDGFEKAVIEGEDIIRLAEREGA